METYVENIYCLINFEKSILTKSGKKNQNFQFKQKFCTKTNFYMWNSIMIFNFYVFDHNLVKKLKIVCSK